MNDMSALVRFAADGLLIVIVGLAGVAGVVWLRRESPPRRRAAIPQAIMAGLTSLLAGKLISLVFQPDSSRPFVERGVEAGAAYINNPGFPSDHVLLAVVIVSAVWWAMRYRRLAVVLAVLVVIMSAARVAALVHTPLDIAGGFAAGLSGAVWYKRR